MAYYFFRKIKLVFANWIYFYKFNDVFDKIKRSTIYLTKMRKMKGELYINFCPNVHYGLLNAWY